MPDPQSRRSLVERRIVRSGVDESREGRPLSRRARQTRRTVEAYLAAGVMPRYMERLREIEAERANLRRRIGRAYRALKVACGDDREAFARDPATTGHVLQERHDVLGLLGSPERDQ
jgi:hypothetical protein